MSKIGPAAQYRHFENYEKVGASTWTTVGTNDAAMPWAVREGTLMVIGSMGGSDMTVFSGATLGGSGTVGSISARSGSTLTPGVGGIGILNVTGNVLIANGTIYRVDLDAGLQSDRIVANGTAEVQGGRVQVNALPGDYRPGSRWTILSAQGGVTGQFSSVTTNLAFFRPILTKDGNNIYLMLPQIRPSTMPADRPIIDPYLPVTEDELPRVLDLTSGEALVSATGVILSHDDLFRAAILCRLRCSMGGLPTFAALDGVQVDYMADMPAHRQAVAAPVAVAPARNTDWAVWGKAIGSWGTTDATATTAAVERTTGGVVFGVDGGLGTPYRFGLAAGYFSTGFDVAGLSSSGTVESLHIGAYGSASLGAFNLRGGVAYAHHEVDVHRAIAFTGFSGTTLSGSSTDSVQAFGEVGYAIPLSERLVIEPFAGLAHVHIDSRAIMEEGSAVAVMGEAHSFDTTYSTLGARLTATLPTSAGLLTFKGMLGWRHAFGDTVPEATFSYVSGSTPFLISGAPIDTDSLVAEAGLNWAVSEKVTLGVAYTGAIGAKNQEHTLRGSLSIRF
ncbi:autotransporter outer membrane beta-barrel domain-containing protein [Microvirga sp. GCM10011540]|uniref:autotransporter family protein n=1 Tax=Microvirga sp. GCM10011540 TaxID=3317338 RepID=UPI0036182955